MVTVIGYQVRQSTEGKNYVTLQLQGDVVFVQSMNTGRHYATVKRCSIYSTFEEDTAKTLIGRQLPGRIERVQTDPYDFTIPETGETIQLAHSWQYFPDEVPTPAVEFA